MDFGLFFFPTRARWWHAGPGLLYLPKMQSHLEARLWNDVFIHAQDALGLPRGTVRATVLIETLPAAFEMDEILYELKDHSAGLNCGRWDYIFSTIKTLREDPDFVIPDRAQVTWNSRSCAPTRSSWSRPARRGSTPWAAWPRRSRSRTTPPPTRLPGQGAGGQGTRRRDGHDGTWVAIRPGAPAREVFDAT